MGAYNPILWPLSIIWKVKCSFYKWRLEASRKGSYGDPDPYTSVVRQLQGADSVLHPRRHYCLEESLRKDGFTHRCIHAWTYAHTTCTHSYVSSGE
jgi:hypothetical protein